MSNIKVNDFVRVVATENYYSRWIGLNGTVVRIFDFTDDPVAIVEFPDDCTAKVPCAALVREERTAPKVKETIPEGAKRITKEEYDRAVLSCIKSDNPKSILVGMSAVVTGKQIGETIFDDADSVVMTEDEYIAFLWDGCSPAAIAERVDNKMSVYQCMDVAIGSAIFLQRTVKMLFGESDNA